MHTGTQVSAVSKVSVFAAFSPSFSIASHGVHGPQDGAGLLWSNMRPCTGEVLVQEGRQGGSKERACNDSARATGLFARGMSVVSRWCGSLRLQVITHI